MRPTWRAGCSRSTRRRSTASTTPVPGCAVSPSARRWIGHLLRFVVTAVAVIVVVRMIRWQDYWAIKESNGRVTMHDLDQIRQVRRAGTTVAVTWADGRETCHSEA